MARKDVELLVKANDQASKLLEGITNAINNFVKAEEGAEDATTGLGSTFSKVSKTIADFAKAWDGATPGQRIARDLDRATKTTERYGQQVEALNKQLAEQQSAMSQTQKTTARLTTDLQTLTQWEAEATAKVTAARTARRDANKEISRAESQIKSLAAAQETLSDRIAKQNDKVGQSQQKYADLQARLAGVEKPTKRLVEQTEAAGRAYDRNVEKLNKLQQAQQAGAADLEKTRAAYTGLVASLKTASDTLDKQKAELSTVREELTKHAAAVRVSEREQTKLAATMKQTEANIASTASELDRAETNFLELSDKAEVAKKSMDALAVSMRVGLSDAIRLQQSNLSKISNSYREVSAQQEALSRVMGAAGVPTKEMADQQARLATVSKEIANLHAREKAALAAMRAELSATASDSSRLVSAQSMFAEALKKSTAALGQAQAGAAKNAQANQQIVTAAEKASRSVTSLARAQDTQSSASRKAASSGSALAEAYKKIYGESRQAMSITQRLRGEILSLTTSYVGIYGIIGTLDKVVDATVTLEQATVRLKSVFNTKTRAEEELDFIRRTANNLALDFGLLSQEYSKFAAATKGTNLEGSKTRQIFEAVAKAARVQALSVDEVQGVMKALTQIASKGRIQLEELSGQLGDRLPGALQIMADGLGITTEELLKMTKQGQVSADDLTKFAEELERRYGALVPDALKTTSSALQGFKNAAFQALAAFGENGFNDGFRDLLESITKTLQSAQFEDFASRVSVAFGVLATALGKVVENFDLVVVAGTAFAGIRLVPVVAGLASAFTRSATAVIASTTAIRTAGAASATAAGQTATLAGAVTGLSVALRALLSSTGIGVAVALISTGVAAWATSATEATEAMKTHEAIVDEVKSAYDRAGGSVKKWSDEIKKKTLTQLEDNAAEQKRLADAARQENAVRQLFIKRYDGLRDKADSESFIKVADGLQRLQDEFVKTGGDIDEYLRKIEELARTSDDPRIRKYSSDLQAAAEAMRPFEERAQEAAAAVKAKAGAAGEADAATLGLSKQVDGASSSLEKAAKRAEDFKDALNELKSFIPGFADELKKLKELKSIDEAYADAAAKVGNMGELYKLNQTYNDARTAVQYGDTLKALEGFTDGVEAATELIKRRESFIDKAAPDYTYRNGQRVNSGYRLGYGSDTITREDGSKQKVSQGDTVTRVQAELDLYRRITTEFMPKVISQIGQGQFSSFNAQQQAVLTSIAYNYGELPDSLVAAVKTGSTEGIVEAIKKLGSDNNGINKGRREEEAAIFGGSVNEEKASEAAAKKAEEIRKAQESQKQYLADLDREIAGQKEGLIVREQNKAIAERERELQKAGLTLSEEEKNQIREKIALKYKDQAAEEAKQANAKTVQEAEQRVNDLLSIRRDLQEQIQLYTENGDGAGVAKTEEELIKVNTQLQEAIKNAIELNNKLGGEGAAANISALQTMQLEARNLANAGKVVLVDWQQVGSIFANNIASGLDKFAQKIAAGENAAQALLETFQEVAAQILIELGQMIIRALIFNAVSGIMKGFGLPGLPGFSGGSVSMFHGGGSAGSPTMKRHGAPAVPPTATRYHSGGVVGYKPDEVGAILKREEEVLTRDDPRHFMNLSKQDKPAAQDNKNLKIINLFDPAQALSMALDTDVGEKALLNVIRNNKDEIKGAIS